MKLKGSLLAVSLLAVFLCVQAVGASHQYTASLHYTAAAAAGATLSVENVTGNISITAWSEDYIDISVVKRSNKSKADLATARVELAKGTHVSIHTVRGLFSHVQVDYTIKVPAKLIVDTVENAAGNIEIEAAVCRTVKNATGNLKIACTAGPYQAHLTTGNFEVRLQSLAEDADLSVSTGQLIASLAPGFSTVLRANVAKGSINCNVPGLNANSAGNGSLQGTIGAGGRRLNLSVATGSIIVNDSK